MNEALSSVEWEFSGDEKRNDFTSVPPGTYLCRIEESRPGLTRSGHTRWGVKFVVHDGPETGRIAAWDGLTFSPNAAARTRQMLAALGLPHEGKVRLSETDLVGRLAWVTVEEQVFRDPATGITSKRNSVPYGGVRPVEGDPRAGEAERDGKEGAAAEIPF